MHNHILHATSNACTRCWHRAAGYSVAIGDTSWRSYKIATHVMLELPSSTSAKPSGSGFFYMASHTVFGSSRCHPEESYHKPFLPYGGGAVLLVSLDGSWSLLSCHRAAPPTTSNVLLPLPPLPVEMVWRSVIGNGFTYVSLALTLSGVELTIVAIVDGKTLVNKMVACRECHIAGSAWLGTGFHHASLGNFSVTRTS